MNTKISRRRGALGVLGVLSSCIGLAGMAGTSALADPAYPSKPVRIVVPYQAGGATDIFARLLAEGLSRKLGQPVVVENRSGASGIIATDHVAKSAPDGYTLLLTTPAPIAANLALYNKLPYDPRTDLRMVSDIATMRTVLAVHPSVPAQDVKSLVAAIQAAPGRYAMGSWGPGTQPHQIQVYMDRNYGLHTLQVPYKGEGPMAMDLISGTVQMTVGSVTALAPHIAAGKLRPLAVVGTQRARALPAVPTFAEQGYAEAVYSYTGPTSLMAPARTPDAVVDALGRAVGEILREPAVVRRIEELGAEPVGNAPAEAAAAYRASLPMLLRLIEATGVKLD